MRRAELLTGIAAAAQHTTARMQLSSTALLRCPHMARSPCEWESCNNRTLAVAGAAFDLDAVW